MSTQKLAPWSIIWRSADFGHIPFLEGSPFSLLTLRIALRRARRRETDVGRVFREMHPCRQLIYVATDRGHTVVFWATRTCEHLAGGFGTVAGKLPTPPPAPGPYVFGRGRFKAQRYTRVRAYSYHATNPVGG